MDSRLSSTSPLPWIWVIETLARSKQVDLSLLLDLVNMFAEISDDISKNARESVALSLLERFSVLSAQVSTLSPDSDPKFGFNPSERAEDVVQKILLEENLKTTALEMLKWDFQPFIAHKRSSLAKSSLQQLKDAIVSGTHPLLASLKERSGFLVDKQPEHRGSDKNTQSLLENNNHLLEKNLTEYHLLPSKRNRADTDKTHSNVVKKCKNGELLTHNQDSLATIDWIYLKMLADASSRISQDGEVEMCVKNTRVEGVGRKSNCTSSKGLSYHKKVTPQDGESNDGDMGSDSDGYCDEWDRIARQKNTFLSSQFTFSQDSFGPTYQREVNQSVKCKKSGKLLVCSSNSCPLVVHDSSLGSEASFDANGRFYCPFCAYSETILERLEIKKRASLARKELANFICVLGTKNKSKKQDDGLCESTEIDRVKKVHNHQLGLPIDSKNGETDNFKKDEEEGKRTGQVCESTEVNGQCAMGAGGNYSKNGETNNLKKDKEEGKKMGQECESTRVSGQCEMVSGANYLKNGEINNLKINEEEGKKTGQECEFLRVNRKGEMGSGANCKSQSENTSNKVMEKELSSEHTCSPSNKPAESAELSESEDSGDSEYFVSFRNKETQWSDPEIPHLRRQRIPWTSDEEQMLKEGMQRFCNDEENIPWKRIFEYGAQYFQEGRTTVDLKDKWRNICKSLQTPEEVTSK